MSSTQFYAAPVEVRARQFVIYSLVSITFKLVMLLGMISMFWLCYYYNFLAFNLNYDRGALFFYVGCLLGINYLIVRPLAWCLYKERYYPWIERYLEEFVDPDPYSQYRNNLRKNRW